MVGSILPVPPQVGQTSFTSSTATGRTRWRVICIRTELRERKDRMLGLVGGHQLGHLVVERLPVDRLVQIDEVDDDDAAQIAQAKLAGDFARRSQIDVQSRLLLVVFGLGAVARIDVDDVSSPRYVR